MATGLTDFLVILSDRASDRARRVSLAELAKHAGLSPSHFQRTFKRLVGESPKQYVLRLQLEHSAVLLLRTEATVLDVALTAGFESHEGFCRAFGRHFGRTPRAFRQEGALEPEVIARHTALIQSVGPCIRLFRALASSTSPQSRTDSHVQYDITIKPMDAITLLCKQMQCAHKDLATAMGQCLPVAFAYAAANNIAMVGPPMTRYVEWGAGVVTIQGGIPVAPGSEAGEGLMIVKVPASRAAVTVHTGSYDGLGDAQAALETFLLQNGHESGGPAIETYLTDPGEVPDPEDWKTLIQKPIAR